MPFDPKKKAKKTVAVSESETTKVPPEPAVGQKRHVSRNGIPYDYIHELYDISIPELIATYGPSAVEFVEIGRKLGGS